MTNPECWPRTAILLTALTIYMLLTLCYFLFYVPVIIGNPLLYFLRITGNIAFLTSKSVMIFFAHIALKTYKVHQRHSSKSTSSTMVGYRHRADCCHRSSEMLSRSQNLRKPHPPVNRRRILHRRHIGNCKDQCFQTRTVSPTHP